MINNDGSIDVVNKFQQGDMDWLKGVLNGQYDTLLSHGRTERIVNHIIELETNAAKTWRATQDAFDEYEDEKSALEARIELLEAYVDHKPECQRRTIHRAFFSDKCPCECGFDSLGVKLTFTPIDGTKKK
jgi:hypothetical protein